MSYTTLYGIKNCDTMKKAFKWLDSLNIAYDFHDYKKQGINTGVLNKAISQYGWEKVISQRGTTWRKLPDKIKNNMNEKTAMKIAQDNPSIIKRPILVHKNNISLGFKPDIYEEIFKA